jgi:hypothetical protein
MTEYCYVESLAIEFQTFRIFREMRFDKTLMHISNENSEIPFRENFFKAVTPNNLGASFFFKRVFSVKIFIEINRFWNHDS